MLDFYVRPTIPFELECNSQSYQKDLTAEISSTAKAINGASFARLAASTTGIAIGFVVACLSSFLSVIVFWLDCCIKNESVVEKAGTVYISV